MLETVKKEVYKTSDGEEFFNKSKAEEHQQYLEKPKVYIVSNLLSSSILLVTKDMAKAKEFKSNYNGIGISIETYILQ